MGVVRKTIPLEKGMGLNVLIDWLPMWLGSNSDKRTSRTHTGAQYESGEVFAAQGRNDADAARLLPEDEAVEPAGAHSHPLRVGRREPLQQALLMAHVTHTSEPNPGTGRLTVAPPAPLPVPMRPVRIARALASRRGGRSRSAVLAPVGSAVGYYCVIVPRLYC